MRSTALFLSVLTASPGWGEADPARRAERLDPPQLQDVLGSSIFGQGVPADSYCRWPVRSGWPEGIRLHAPGFCRESWTDEIILDDKEAELAGLDIVALEGTRDLLIPRRP